MVPFEIRSCYRLKRLKLEEPVGRLARQDEVERHARRANAREVAAALVDRARAPARPEVPDPGLVPADPALVEEWRRRISLALVKVEVHVDRRRELVAVHHRRLEYQKLPCHILSMGSLTLVYLKIANNITTGNCLFIDRIVTNSTANLIGSTMRRFSMLTLHA